MIPAVRLTAEPTVRPEQTEPDDELLTPAEVARLFRVSPKTVTRWADEGLLSCVRTLGGHRRFPAGAVRALRERAATDATRPVAFDRSEPPPPAG
jgi:excisionase family DNA binding protein